MFAQHGAVVIDTDLIAREVVQPPSPVLDSIRREFGDGVLRSDGSLDRSALGRIVFRDPVKRKTLNELTHPAILKRVLTIIAAQPVDAVVVVVVPLLFESHFEQNCHAVVAVVASPDARRQRLRKRDDLPPGEIDARIGAQMSDAEYAQRSAIVLHNNGDIRALQRSVDGLWADLTRAADQKGRS